MRITKNVRITLWIVTSLLLLFSIGYTLYLAQNKLEISFNGSDWRTFSFCDSEDQDTTCSEVHSFSNKGGVFKTTYTLGTSINFPYAGVITDRKGNRTWDLSNYDSVVVDLPPTETNDFTFMLIAPVEGKSDLEKPNTWRIFEYDYNIIPNQSRYAVHLERFITPNWWFKSNHFDSKQFPIQDLRFIKRILFQNHPNHPKGKTYKLAINKITFKKSLKRSIIPWILTIIFGLTSLIFRPQKVSNIPYHQLDVENIFTEETKTLVDYLAENYNNTELTLTMTSIDTKLSEKKIRKLLNDNFKKSFKQYLTDIRMVEAKRLLKETDRSISEVGLLVGYSHTPTFTRNFRTQFGKLPSKYRKN